MIQSIIIALIIFSIGMMPKRLLTAENQEIAYTQILESPLSDSLIVTQAMGYKKKFNFIRYQDNYIEWEDSTAMIRFFKALTLSDARKAKVLHIGDSHIQADFFTGTLRDKMQDLFGVGGRGLVFPYASASTHATRDYRTLSYGVWKYAKNIHTAPAFSLGLSGATIYTEDLHAGFRIIFREGFIHQNDKVLKIYCDQNKNVFDVRVIVNSTDTLLFNCTQESHKPYVRIMLPEAARDIKIELQKKSEIQNYFQCYGLSIENTSYKGILYHSAGINGAGYTSILRQGMMPEQLKEMNPDMICIDLGANDFYPKNIDKPVFEDNLRNIIKLMKGVCPGVTIIVTCSQDIYCRKKNIAECKAFAQIARNIAFEMQCGFYDYYHISGGQYAMNKWYVQKLAKPDRVHLTAEGYYVKGELYFNAMIKSYLYWLKNPGEALIRNVSVPEIHENITTPKHSIPDAPAQSTHTYIVQSGDNLGKIAMRFGTSVSQIKDWNQLNDDNIRIGQKLKIHSAQPAIRTQPHQSTPQSPAKGGITYTVKSGDSLWSISQKYKTTTDKIRQLNGLKSDKLVPGMKLRIP